MFVDKFGLQKKYNLSSWSNKDLTGYRFGMIQYTKRLSNHKKIWWAQCICGRDMLVLPPHRFYKGEPIKTSCYCSGDLNQDYSILPRSEYIDLPHLTLEHLETLYEIWIDQVINPSTTKTDDDWYFRDGVNHCTSEWYSFYVFCSDVGIPPEGSTMLKKQIHTEPLSRSNFYWSTTARSGIKVSPSKELFQSKSLREKRVILKNEIGRLVSSYLTQ